MNTLNTPRRLFLLISFCFLPQAAIATPPAEVGRLVAWFKADAGTYQNSNITTAASADNDPVGAWVDQSGNGFNALQATSGNRPQLRTSALNSLPAVEFIASNFEWLTLDNFTMKPRNWTIFVVMMTTNAATRQSPHGSVDSAGTSAKSWGNAVISQTVCASSGSAAPDFGDGTNTTLSCTNGVWTSNTYNYMTYVYKAGDAYVNVYKNGVKQSTSEYYSAATECKNSGSPSQEFDFSLGREGELNLLYLDGRIAEFIMYDTNLLPADRVAIENYLSAKWNL